MLTKQSNLFARSNILEIKAFLTGQRAFELRFPE
jgi:hypothetical protein